MCLFSSLAAEQMDQVSNRSGLASDEVTDESASMVDVRFSTEDDEVKNGSLPLFMYILLCDLILMNIPSYEYSSGYSIYSLYFGI